MPSVYEFGPFRLDPAERLLLREGTPVSLTPKAFDVLVQLVTRHGHLYVVPVEQTGPRQIVSVDGAVQPRWRADGRELFYLGLDGTLFAVYVNVRPDGRLAFSRPVPLFNSGLVVPSQEVEQYAVSNDGQRFMILLPLDNRIHRSVGVLQNWPALVRAATATAP